MSTRQMTTDNFREMIKEGTVFVDLWAPWCGPCRAFAPIYDGVAAKHPDLVFAKVNTEEEQGLASALAIQAIPTLMVFRDGILLFRQAGMLSAAALESLVTQIAQIDMNEVRKSLAAANAEDAAKKASRSVSH